MEVSGCFASKNNVFAHFLVIITSYEKIPLVGLNKYINVHVKVKITWKLFHKFEKRLIWM